MNAISLIVGLGNPGKEYKSTRHNVGAWFAQTLAERTGANFKSQKKLFSEACQITINDAPVHVMLPQTFMNESGFAVNAYAKYYKIAPCSILVVHDELDLPAGKVRLKQGGGHAGHNGIRHIIQQLGSNDFWRLRIGIAHPGHKHLVLDHVLGKPDSAELSGITQAIEDAVNALPEIVKGNFQAAMRSLHNI